MGRRGRCGSRRVPCRCGISSGWRGRASTGCGSRGGSRCRRGTRPLRGGRPWCGCMAGRRRRRGANFRADMQALLAQGYAVLMPNVRGSTGYGRAFMDADDVERRLDAVHDLAAGRAWLAAQPAIDPARIAVMGQSYGGYMVLAAVTEYPALWRCAIDLYGIADFGTLLAGTGPWRRAHRAAEYGDPVRHRALVRPDLARSAMWIGSRVPMLVLHGTHDPRVAFSESEQVHAAPCRRGAVRLRSRCSTMPGTASCGLTDKASGAMRTVAGLPGGGTCDAGCGRSGPALMTGHACMLCWAGSVVTGPGGGDRGNAAGAVHGHPMVRGVAAGVAVRLGSPLRTDWPALRARWWVPGAARAVGRRAVQQPGLSGAA